MYKTFLTAFIILFGVSVSSIANAKTLTGDYLKSTLQGRVLNLSTQLGALPIRYEADGTMSGKSKKMAKFMGFSADQGRWWVSGGKLCQKWKKLFDKRTICYRLNRVGKKIRWSGGGRSGYAHLSK